MINDLFQHLQKNNLSPNLFYTLWTCNQGTQPVFNTQPLDLRLLKTDGFVTEDNQLTDKSRELIAQTEELFAGKKPEKQPKIVLGEEGLANVTVYREMFPKGKLPSGKQGRQDIKELEKKFLWFFKAYPEYTWDIILEATRRYVEEYAQKDYFGMRCSTFFISKQDLNKMITSDLANYCSDVVDEPESVPQVIHASQEIR